jgi:hypothetical protein
MVKSSVQHSLKQITAAFSTLLPRIVLKHLKGASSQESVKKAIRLPTPTTQVFVPVQTLDLKSLAQEVHSLVRESTILLNTRATSQATNHAVVQPSKPPGFQPVMMVRHKDSKKEGRQYLVQETTTGVKPWKSSTGFQDLVGLFELTLPVCH